MLTLILTVGVAAAAVWKGTQYLEAQKHVQRIQELESLAIQAQSETVHLKQQVGNLKTEISTLQRTLGEERISKQEALQALAVSLRGTVVGVGLLTFVLGGVTAGVFSWKTASWKTKSQLVSERFDEKLQFEITKIKLELASKQLEQAQEENKKLKMNLHQEELLRMTAENRIGVSLPDRLPAFMTQWSPVLEGARLNASKLEINQNESENTPLNGSIIKT